MAHIARRDAEERFTLLATLFLICAVLASLALGVLTAYGLCLLLFRIFRAHAASVTQPHPVPVATAPQN